MKTIKKLIFPLLALAMLIGCTPEEIPDTDSGTDIVAPEYGTLEVEFRIPGSYLPPNRILRADLSIAASAEDLFKGNFVYVANVYNSTLVYKIQLTPGNYYFQAGIVCVAEGDSCSAAGYPGGHMGTKWAIGKAYIQNNESIHVVPQFTQ